MYRLSISFKSAIRLFMRLRFSKAGNESPKFAIFEILLLFKSNVFSLYLADEAYNKRISTRKSSNSAMVHVKIMKNIMDTEVALRSFQAS